jgi:hypothetical protein
VLATMSICLNLIKIEPAVSHGEIFYTLESDPSLTLKMHVPLIFAKYSMKQSLSLSLRFLTQLSFYEECNRICCFPNIKV